MALEDKGLVDKKKLCKCLITNDKPCQCPRIWRIRVYVPGQRQAQLTFRGTRRQAEKRERDLQVDAARGDVISSMDGQRTLVSVIEDRLAAKRTLAEETSRAYETALRLHIRPGLDGMRMKGLENKAEALTTFFETVQVEAGPSMRRRCEELVRTALKHSVGRAIKVNPLRDVPMFQPDPAPDYTPGAIQVVAVRDDLLNAVRANRVEAEIRAAVVEALLGTGARIGEVLAFSMDDVDDEGFWTVQRQIRYLPRLGLAFAPPKGGKIRRVPLPPFVIDRMERLEALAPPSMITLPWKTLKPTAQQRALKTPPGEPKIGSPVRSRLSFYNLRRGGLAIAPPAMQNTLRAAGVRVLKLQKPLTLHAHGLRHAWNTIQKEAGTPMPAIDEISGHKPKGSQSATVYGKKATPRMLEQARTAIQAAWENAEQGLDPNGQEREVFTHPFLQRRRTA